MWLYDVVVISEAAGGPGAFCLHQQESGLQSGSVQPEWPGRLPLQVHSEILDFDGAKAHLTHWQPKLSVRVVAVWEPQLAPLMFKLTVNQIIHQPFQNLCLLEALPSVLPENDLKYTSHALDWIMTVRRVSEDSGHTFSRSEVKHERHQLELDLHVLTFTWNDVNVNEKWLHECQV